MTDWLSCTDCGTIYEYDCVRKVSDCPYCATHQADFVVSTAVASDLEPVCW